MEQRYQEGSENRQRQQYVGDGDDLEGDKRHPDQVEHGRRDGDHFGAEPVQPAERKFALLIAIEPAHTREELAPVLLHDLHRAAGPPRPLGLEGQIVLRQQSPTIAAVGVVGAPAKLQDRQSEVAVLANRVARPTAGGLQRGTADQAHRAMDDDGVDLVALDHADVEEPGIFGVHGGVDLAAVAIAMILRCLDQSDLGIGEAGDQILEPCGIDHIVGIDDADDLGFVSSLRHRQPQRRGLEAYQVLHANELEARAKLAAASLDRLPERRIGGVVDDDHALEVGVVSRATNSMVRNSISGGSR